MKRPICVLFVLCGITVFGEAVPTAKEYAHSLEAQFSNGVSAASIRAIFETNGLYTIYEILPYCYDYAVETNDLEGSVSRYQEKIAFIEAIMPRGLIEVSSNVIEQTSARLNKEYWKLKRSVRERYEANPTPENRAYWEGIYPRAFEFLYSRPAEKAFTVYDTRMRTKDARDLVQRTLHLWPKDIFQSFLNISNYVFRRDELYAELSTNTQFNADELLKYCLTDRSDFATNNIAIAEKQIWRNNFVLEIVTHSCNLHTNDKNRAYNAAYTNKLTEILAHYETISEPHLGMAGVELNEWRTRLRDSIRAYVESINPFRPSSFGE